MRSASNERHGSSTSAFLRTARFSRSSLLLPQRTAKSVSLALSLAERPNRGGSRCTHSCRTSRPTGDRHSRPAREAQAKCAGHSRIRRDRIRSRSKRPLHGLFRATISLISGHSPRKAPAGASIHAKALLRLRRQTPPAHPEINLHRLPNRTESLRLGHRNWLGRSGQCPSEGG